MAELEVQNAALKVAADQPDARRRQHDQQVLPDLSVAQLPDEAERVVQETGWLAATGCLPQPPRDARTTSSISVLLLEARSDGGRMRTAPAQPGLANAAQEILAALIRSKIIDVCDPDPLCSMRQSHVRIVILEDWKPRGFGDITANTVDLLRHPSSTAIDGTLLHLRSYEVHAESLPTRMSCTGFSGQASMCEVTEEAKVPFAFFDIILGYEVIDWDAPPHYHVRPIDDIRPRDLGRCAFFLIFFKSLFVSNLASLLK